MKKVIILSMSLLVLITLTGCGKKKEKAPDIDKPKEELTEIEEKVENGTGEKQGDYEITNQKIKELGATIVVTGEITNVSDTTKNVELTLLMTDSKTGRLYGIVNTEIMNLNSQETKEFELSIIGDYENVDTYEVRAKELTVIDENPIDDSSI